MKKKENEVKNPLIQLRELGYLIKKGKEKYFLKELEKIEDRNILNISGSGLAPLCKASQKGVVEVVRILLQIECVDVNLGNPLNIASENGHKEVVELLLNDKRLFINNQNNNPLCGAVCWKENLEIVELLLKDKRVDINHGNPFGRACSLGDAEMVKLFLKDKRLNVNQPYNQHIYSNLTNTSPLGDTCMNGHDHIVKLLLTHPKIDINQGEMTPLHFCCSRNQYECAKLLLSREDIDVNKQKEIEGDYFYKSSLGDTALHILCRHVFEDDNIFQMLIQHPNIRFDIENDYRETPFTIIERKSKNDDDDDDDDDYYNENLSYDQRQALKERAMNMKEKMIQQEKKNIQRKKGEKQNRNDQYERIRFLWRNEKRGRTNDSSSSSSSFVINHSLILFFSKINDSN